MADLETNPIYEEQVAEEMSSLKEQVLNEITEQAKEALGLGEENIGENIIESIIQEGDTEIKEEEIKLTKEEYDNLPLAELQTQNIIAQPTEDDLIALCPYLVDIKIKTRYQKYIDQYFEEEPEEIADINFDEVKERFLCWYLTDKNLRDIFETGSSKGKGQSYIDDLKNTMKRPDLTSFLNFQIIDESDVVIANLHRMIFPIYRKMVFEASANKVFLFWGTNTDNFRKILCKELIWFDELIEKYKTYSDLTPKEFYLLKREYRMSYKKIMVPNPEGWRPITLYTSAESNMLKEINQAIFEAEASREVKEEILHPLIKIL